MIDFIKALVIGADVKALRENPLLEFTANFNETTGEVCGQSNRMPRSWATYNGLTFVIFENGRVRLDGSLHKYRNQGVHNYNDFSLDAINEVLTDLKEKFSISPEQLELQNLEIGVNIVPPYPTDRLLDHCFLHSTKQFSNINKENEERFMSVDYQQYTVKLYDKALQYRDQVIEFLGHEILRFEIKFTKSARLKPLGIVNLQDVISRLNIFADILVKEWRKVLFYDFTIDSSCIALKRYRNPLFWKGIAGQRSAFKKHRNKLRELTANYSKNISHQIENLILEKATQLLERGAQINGTSNLNRGAQINNTFEELGMPFEKNKGAHINSLDKGLNRVPFQKRYCIVSGVDISIQREGTKYLQIIGLRYYQENDPDFFADILKAYMPKSHTGAPIEKQIMETAKAIRDKARPSRITRLRRYNPAQIILPLYTNT